MARIEWIKGTQLGSSGWDGTVNEKRLFTIEWSMTKGEGWKLSTRLPYVVRKETLINQREEILMELAERILVAFVKKIGAEFPDDH